MRSQMDAANAQAQHATSLLEVRFLITSLHTNASQEAEASNARLLDQTKVLKEEIRRLERNSERQQHLAQIEYLKNVIVKVKLGHFACVHFFLEYNTSKSLPYVFDSFSLGKM